jgi:ubiquinone/menaquinone biosynthesis C-methylase UbiE
VTTRGRNRRYLPGLLYDGLLEVLLRSIKSKTAELVGGTGLSPVLDICCGTGRQAELAARGGQLSVGLDINPRLMKYAASRRPEVPFVCGDAAQPPFRASSFPAVIISFALHDKPPEIRPLILNEAKRLLAPEGRMFLVDFEPPWNKNSRRASFYVALIERLAGRRHFRNNRDFLRRGGLRALLAENGLTELERHDLEAGACAILVAAPGSEP